ncbi:MAG: putative hydrolase [Rhodobacteraceae bacterium HLUCCA12]|nr:MAG: putative hydrolase [Rhodobacteraceae bacterium HLUCCA12]
MKRPTLIAATMLSLLATTAGAQIVSGPFGYSDGETEFRGHVAHNPAVEEPRGVVLIVHDWDGVTAYEETRAEMLAAQGYTAFAVDLFGTETALDGGEDYRAATGALYGDRDLFRARLRAAIDAAAEIPGGDGAMVMIGYCFGGAAVLEAARMGVEMEGFVSFHGGLDLPDGQDYASVTAPVQLFHGSADPVSGMGDLAALLDGLQEAGVSHGAEVFGGARHSFTVWGSDDYDLAADRGSWSGLLAFLDRVL